LSEFWSSFTREQTDEQYNPTLWTQRLPTDDLLPAHISFTSKQSESYRKKIGDLLQTASFGEGEFAGSMDIFRSENVKKNAPIVIYIHGGWWQWFSKEQFSFLAEPFNKNGIAVYMPGYRMAQDWENDTPMESILKQMEYATAAVLEEADQRESPAVYLVGHSAGGQLVTMLCMTNWRNNFNLSSGAQKKLKGVFSLAGLFDIRPLVDSFINDAIKMSLKSAETVSPQLAPSFLENHICPLHLVLPEFDTPEFFRQTKEYQNKLLKAGQPCFLKVVNNRDHLDIIEKLTQDNDELLHYLLKNMNI
jgi:arylformamidase